MLIEVKHPQFGVLREVGSPVKTPGAITTPAPAPALGQHTEPLLRALLHYSPERIAALRASGALGPPAGTVSASRPVDESRAPHTRTTTS